MKQVLDMIESNKKTKKILIDAFLQQKQDELVASTDKVREYQEEVRKRLKDKKAELKKQEYLNVQYIASMLPSALDMHRFIKLLYPNG